jgi:hypothetical protein
MSRIQYTLSTVGATATLQWGERGTWRTPVSDRIHPIAIDGSIRNALLVNQNQLHSNPFVVSSTYTTDLTVSALRYTVPFPSNVQEGDVVVLILFSEGFASTTVEPSDFVLATSTTLTRVYYRRQTKASSTSEIRYTDVFGNEQGQLILVVRGLDPYTELTSFEESATANSADPAAVSPGWAADAGSFVLVTTAEDRPLPANTVTGYPSGYTISQNTNTLTTTPGTNALRWGTAWKVLEAGNVTEDPSTFTYGLAVGTVRSLTVAFRSANRGELRVRTNYRAIQPPALTNSQTFYAHSINISSGLTVTAPFYTNSNTLNAHSVRTRLTASLLTNANTLRAHSVRTRLTAPIFTNTSTLRAHSIRTRITAPLYQNTPNLRAHSVRVTLRAPLLTNSNTLNAHSIRTRLTAPLLTNANTLRAHSIRATIKPVNLVNSNVLNAHSIRTIIKPGVFTNTNTFYAHAVAVAGANKQVPLLANTSILQAHSIRLRVTATNLVNGSVLYSHSIRRRLTAPLLTNSNSLFSHSIRRRVTASLLTNANTFYSHRLRTLVTASLLTNTSVFFGHTVLAGNNVSVPLLVNTNAFGAHTVIVAATDFVPSGNFGGWISHGERKRLDRESQRRAALARVKKLYARDVAIPHLVNQNRLYGHGVIILPSRDMDDLGLSPIEIDEITDILDALEAIEAMDTINDLTGRAS